jgi:hypothetical protein
MDVMLSTSSSVQQELLHSTAGTWQGIVSGVTAGQPSCMQQCMHRIRTAVLALRMELSWTGFAMSGWLCCGHCRERPPASVAVAAWLQQHIHP